MPRSQTDESAYMTSSATAMAPRPLAVFMRELRAQIAAAASSSVNAPETAAAAISPMLCPTTAPGSMPRDRHSSARAAITAKRQG
jgi:hypothetical protein